MSRFRRFSCIFLGGATVTAVGSFGYLHSTDEGFRRAVRLYSTCVPVVLHYRLVQEKHKLVSSSPELVDAEWRALDERHSGRVVSLVKELGGVYVKYGQIAAGLTNTFSALWIDKLRTLEDQCPPHPFENVLHTLANDMADVVVPPLPSGSGTQSVVPTSPWHVFESIATTPLGAASIGQVHLATLTHAAAAAMESGKLPLSPAFAASRKDSGPEVPWSACPISATGGPERRKVAVKVQSVIARRLFGTDMRTIRQFLEIFAPEQVLVLAELERSTEREFNYHHEADALAHVGHNLTVAGFMPKDVVVPRPLLPLCTHTTLVMEYLAGPKLKDGIDTAVDAEARRRGMTSEGFVEMMKKKFETEGIDTTYRGPSAWTIAALVLARHAAYDMANAAVFSANAMLAVAVLACRVVAGAHVPRVSRLCRDLAEGAEVATDDVSVRGGVANAEFPTGVLPTAGEALTSEATSHRRWLRPFRRFQLPVDPPNPPRVMDLLMRVHGHQLLVDGLFNADPHPGNFLLLKDGRIGLIDYGATKRLSRGERLISCALFVALARGDRRMIVDIARQGGYRSPSFDEDVINDLVRFGFDTYGRDLMKGRNVQQFMDELWRKDPWQEVADNLVMAQFLSIRLRTVGLQMNYPVVCSRWWGPLAESVLKQEGYPYDTWTPAIMDLIMPKSSLRLARV
eukprot:TRINITY_DN7199_c0_g1_i1.p1 TRINITY_DN7199_c0_g1~~TRINITY_DN7199_c0_g1_i1.p1  ORF type:complete len:684 (-),score=97.69 TRINITY_DN7199_c0_g1_i1:44-2095(-)